MRILVVDDEALIRWSVSETLAQAGHSVAEAIHAAAARRALREAAEPFDVVLLDFRLPDSNDLQLLADMRRIAPRTAIVMMSAYGTPEVTQGALDLGAFRCINKPFDMQDIVHILVEANANRPQDPTVA